MPGHLQDSYPLVDSIKQNTSLKESRRSGPPILKVVHAHAMRPWEGYTSIFYTHTGRNEHTHIHTHAHTWAHARTFFPSYLLS